LKRVVVKYPHLPGKDKKGEELNKNGGDLAKRF